MGKKTPVIQADQELSAEMRAILDAGGPDRTQPGDLTVKIAMKYWGLGEAQTYVRLGSLVEVGSLTKHTVVIGGKCHVVWRPVKKRKK